MPLTPNVGTGQVIQTTWGNAIRDRTVQRFTSRADLLASWPAPPDGAFGYLVDEHSLCVAKGGTWRWWTKDFPVASGSTTYFTWSAGMVVASSVSSLSINGRNIALSLYGSIASQAASGNITVGTLAAGYRPAARIDQPSTLSLAAGAQPSRSAISPDGTITFVWSGTAGGIATLLGASWTVADLIAA